MLLDNFFDEGEAEAGSDYLRGRITFEAIELLKDALPIFLRYPVAAISHDDAKVRSIALHLDNDFRVVRAVLDCVAQRVVDGLLQCSPQLEEMERFAATVIQPRAKFSDVALRFAGLG